MFSVIFFLTHAAIEAIKEIVLIFLLLEGVLLFVALLNSNDIFHRRVIFIVIETGTVAL